MWVTVATFGREQNGWNGGVKGALILSLSPSLSPGLPVPLPAPYCRCTQGVAAVQAGVCVWGAALVSPQLCLSWKGTWSFPDQSSLFLHPGDSSWCPLRRGKHRLGYSIKWGPCLGKRVILDFYTLYSSVLLESFISMLCILHVQCCCCEFLCLSLSLKKKKIVYLAALGLSCSM